MLFLLDLLYNCIIIIATIIAVIATALALIYELFTFTSKLNSGRTVEKLQNRMFRRKLGFIVDSMMGGKTWSILL